MNSRTPDPIASVETATRCQIATSIVVAAMLASLLALALWDLLAAPLRAYWLLTLLGVLALRLGLLYLRPDDRHLQLSLTALAGLLWGATVPLFLSGLDAQHQLLLVIILIGLVAGTSNAYAGRMQLFYAFMLPVLIPLGFWFFSQSGGIYTTLGIADLIYMAALSMIARRNTGMLDDMMRNNEQLAAEVRQRQAHEQLLELQQQILDAIARHRGVLADILNTIVRRVEAQRPDMIASILLLDDDGRHVRSGAAPGLPDAWNAAVGGIEIGPCAGSCGTAMFSNERVIVSDIANDPLWADYRDAAQAFGLRACWSEPIRDADGGVIGSFAMYYRQVRSPDEAELQQIEQLASLTSVAIDNCRNRARLQTAREQESRLAAIVEHSNDLIFAMDMEGRIMTANSACREQFGGEVVGRNVFDIVAPEHRERLTAMLARKRRDGGNTIYEVDAIDRDGRRHNLEINSTLISRDGAPVAVHAIARDMTARRQTEQQLELLIQAIDASRESIMVLDGRGLIEFANPAAAVLYRRPMEQIIGMQAAELRGGSEGDATYNEILSTINNGQSWNGEMLFHPDGNEQRLVARRISPIMDEQGQVHHQICIDRDITEAKQRSQQLEHTQRLESLGLLAGGIAHDFNNLLTAILGNAAMAERGIRSGDDVSLYLSHIRQSSQRAADLCKQMLAYSGKGRFVIEPVDISALVRDMTRLMEVSIGKHVTVRYALNEDLPPIDGDPAQIQQVILNLITNANEAIGDAPGEIVFSTGVIRAGRAELDATLTGETLPDGEYVSIEVADSGCGMDQATIEKMFDPFFTTKFTGRGLGMSAILGIVRGHHGAISVDSRPGEGTTFRIMLPVGQSARRPSAASAEPLAQPDGCRGTVLVVDDEPFIREVVCAMLADLGFDVLQAEDGEQAIERYRAHPGRIAVVLLDMTMPKMDGKHCLAELKRIDPDVRVLLSSGYSVEEVSELFADQSPAGFIQKPYLPESLQRHIAAILGQQY